MKRQLNDAEMELYRFISETIRRKGYPPSITEMMEATNYTSRGGMAMRLQRLESAGYIRRFGETPRQMIELTGKDSSYTGEVNSLVVYDTDGRITERVPAPVSGTDRFLLKTDTESFREKTFYKKTELVAGDLLLVDRNTDPSGSAVIVLSGTGKLQVVNEPGKFDKICGVVVGFYRE